MYNELYQTALYEYYNIRKIKKLLKKTSANIIPTTLSKYVDNDNRLTIPMLLLFENKRDAYNYIPVIELFILKGYDLSYRRGRQNLLDYIIEHDSVKFKNKMLETLKRNDIIDFLFTNNSSNYHLYKEYDLISNDILEKYKFLESAHELNLL